MALRKSVALILVIYLLQSMKPVISAEKDVIVQTNDSTGSGFGFELLLSKMDYLEYKFLELDFEIKEQNEQIMRNQDQLEKTHSGMTWMLTRMEQAVGQNFTEIMDQSWKILQQQKSCSNHDTLRKEIFNLKPIRGPSNLVKPPVELQQVQISKGPFETCKDEPSKVSGKYILQPFGQEGQFEGYCEQTKFGGGWIVIQHRFNGSLDFYRNWTEYQRGFGEPDKEYWIGLDLLHNLTKGQTHHLMVELEDYSGNYKYAKYSGFEIGSEAEKYSLKTLGTYSGTASDSLNYHKGKKFSTFDNDNDSSSSNDAQDYTGAWWYSNGYYSNLNGAYITGSNTKSMNWYHFGNAHTGLKYSRMMIRKA